MPKRSKEEYNRLREEYNSSIFEKKEVCDDCLDTQQEGKAVLDQARAVDGGKKFFADEDLEEMANYELNIYKKFGVAWPIMCCGGIGFGSFLLYKTFTSKSLRISKFLLI